MMRQINEYGVLMLLLISFLYVSFAEAREKTQKRVGRTTDESEGKVCCTAASSEPPTTDSKVRGEVQVATGGSGAIESLAAEAHRLRSGRSRSWFGKSLRVKSFTPLFISEEAMKCQNYWRGRGTCNDSLCNQNCIFSYTATGGYCKNNKCCMCVI